MKTPRAPPVKLETWPRGQMSAAASRATRLALSPVAQLSLTGSFRAALQHASHLTQLLMRFARRAPVPSKAKRSRPPFLSLRAAPSRVVPAGRLARPPEVRGAARPLWAHRAAGAAAALRAGGWQRAASFAPPLLPPPRSPAEGPPELTGEPR